MIELLNPIFLVVWMQIAGAGYDQSVSSIAVFTSSAPIAGYILDNTEDLGKPLIFDLREYYSYELTLKLEKK